jgi:hypothetical protein
MARSFSDEISEMPKEILKVKLRKRQDEGSEPDILSIDLPLDFPDSKSLNP